MGSVHQRVIKTKPAVERVVLIETLEFFQRQTSASAPLTELRFVLSGYSNGVEYNLQVFFVIFGQGWLLLPHSILLSWGRPRELDSCCL